MHRMIHTTACKSPCQRRRLHKLLTPVSQLELVQVYRCFTRRWQAQLRFVGYSRPDMN